MRRRWKPLHALTRQRHPQLGRNFTVTPLLASKHRTTDESKLAGVQHRISLSGPSLGHLVSELSATRPGMEAIRQPGQTMSEEHRTLARRVVQWIVGVPLTLGTIIVGVNWVQEHRDDSAT